MNTTQNTTIDQTSKSMLQERMLAVQCCYAFTIREMNFCDLNKTILDFLDYQNSQFNKNPIDKDYFKNLVKNSLEFLPTLDQKISDYLTEDWALNRLPKAILAILRIGCYEIYYSSKKDIPIVINDFLKISNLLNHKGEIGFINSILDKVAKKENSSN